MTIVYNSKQKTYIILTLVGLSQLSFHCFINDSTLNYYSVFPTLKLKQFVNSAKLVAPSCNAKIMTVITRFLGPKSHMIEPLLLCGPNVVEC